ncbi:MAG TPA: SDR family oxidoreductase [Verrucomicrobiales bacterium]|nr:SDR family oxidoreductase [Verrucomicrobiales bacterium]
MYPERFKNQVALVTGGAQGIGMTVALRLGREGAHIVLLDRNADALAKAVEVFVAQKVPVSTIQGDIANESEIEHAMESVVSQQGRLDVVVHCAAIVGPTNTPLAEVKVEDFDQVYEVNLRGSMIVTKQALKAMLPNKYGRILLLASIAGKEGNAGMSPYSSTKAGVIGLVKSAGKDYAESGVTINALAPAVIRTPMVDECHPDQVKYMTDKIPMKRCGTLDEVAAIACWIVSREAGFNTGATFDLSGGRAVY